MEYPKFKVCVKCFTFNQSKYITDAMNGFCMQQTDFPFICCIVDDASTDGEQEVINNYLEEHFNLSDNNVSYKKETDYAYITYSQHNDNKNCYFVVLLLKENHYGKKPKYPYITEWRNRSEYEALCEGDDYWISDLKLQKQVNLMSANKECSLCFHNAYYERNGKKAGKHRIYSKSCYAKTEHIFRDGGFIPSASIMYRLDMFRDYESYPKNGIAGDIRLQTFAATKGKVYYINEIMAVYRLVSSSATHVVMKSSNKLIERQQIFKEWYDKIDVYTKGKFHNEIEASKVFCDARIARIKKDYRELRKAKYYKYFMSLKASTRYGLLFGILGMNGLTNTFLTLKRKFIKI